MRRRRPAGPARVGPIVGAVAVFLLATPALAWAQQAPPAVRPPALPSFPTFEERTLSNGASVLILPNSMLPWVDVSLILPGGRAADLEEMSGTAELVARLITKGTARHSVSELAEALDRSAVNLAAVVGTDWMTVSIGSLTTQLDSALSVLADVVLRPSFPQTEVQQARRRRVVALQTAWMEPRAMASRAFRRAVYGTHPYGAYESPERVRDLTTEDLREYQRRVFRPDGAVFLVSGRVDPDDITNRLEAHFSEWDRADARPSRGANRDTAGIAGPGGARPQSVIVHAPGSTRAVIRMGHTLVAGDSPDWPGLLLLGQILGGGPEARLGDLARSRGWAGAAVATMNRRRGPGLLEIGLDVRVEVADTAVAEIVTLLEQLRSEAPGIEETEALQEFISAALPLQLSTARQVVGQIGRTRLLADVSGESSGLLTEYAAALRALTPEGLRRVAREHLRPGEVSVVVVGDARLLRPRLAALGSVRMVDADGRDLGLADLTPAVTPLTTDASSLGPGSWRYRVSADGEVVGEMVRVLSTDAGGAVGRYSLSSSTTVGPQTLAQEVTFDGGEFRPLSASFQFTQGAQRVGARIAVVEGRTSGSRTLPDGRTEPFDTPFVPGALVGEMLEVAVWMADLSEGLELVLPVVQVESGATAYVRVRVLDRTRVTVPAGRYDVYRIEIVGPQAPQLVYARVGTPHIIVKLETPGQPFVIELEADGAEGGLDG